MAISRDEALEALQQLERTETRAVDARVYRTTGGHLIVWGLVWAVGYTLTGLRMDRASLIWPPLIAVGFIAGFLVSRIARARRGAGPRLSSWRWAAQALAIVLFMAGTYVVFPITSPVQPMAFPALMIAFMYALVGSARLTRMLWIGAALFVLTLTGVVFLKPFLAFWLAAVGGGGLIAGGLWLRSA